MSSSEEDFFNSLKKKRKRNDISTDGIVSSDEEAHHEPHTPTDSCARRSTVCNTLGNSNCLHGYLGGFD